MRPLGCLSHRSVELKASKIGARSGAACCPRRRPRQHIIDALNAASQQANTPFAVHKPLSNCIMRRVPLVSGSLVQPLCACRSIARADTQHNSKHVAVAHRRGPVAQVAQRAGRPQCAQPQRDPVRPVHAFGAPFVCLLPSAFCLLPRLLDTRNSRSRMHNHFY